MMMMMKRLAVISLIVVATALGLARAEVPFAEPPPQGAESYRLADIMSATQWRHIKLWYAIRARNWELTNYELEKLSETFDRAAALYLNIPIELVGEVAKPIRQMRDAIATKSALKFETAFETLTEACNACHRAAQIGFVTIQTPTTSPFSDQKFQPNAK